MTEKEQGAKLAMDWIEAWINMDKKWMQLNLGDDFIHTSPFGRLEG